MPNITDPVSIATARRPPVLQMLLLLLLALASLACARPASAQVPAGAGDDLYTVSGVSVTATADSATAARDKAVAEGHVNAYRRLVERLAVKGDVDRAPPLDANGVAGLLRGFEVQEEKRSDVRYTATLRFLFRPDAVRRLLGDAGIGFAESRGQPRLVLPVFRTAGGSVLLWEEDNAWRTAWETVAGGDGLIPLMVPLADLADMRDITAEQALAPDDRRLRAIAERYGAAGTIVLLAQLDKAGAGQAVQVSSAWYGGSAPEKTVVTSVAGKPDEPVDELMRRAATTVRSEIQAAWKEDNSLPGGRESELVVSVPIAGFGDWLSVRRRLGEVAIVRSNEVMSMSRTAVVLRLRYAGDEARLGQALARAGLGLQQGADGWTLREDGREARSTGRVGQP